MKSRTFYALFENTDGTTSVGSYHSQATKDEAVTKHRRPLGADVGAGRLGARACTKREYEQELERGALQVERDNII